MRLLPLAAGLSGLVLAAGVASALAGTHKGYATSTTHHAAATRRHAKRTSAGDVLRAPLAPSVPADPTISRAKPGAAPWVLRSGDVVVAADGHVALHLTGFLIPGKGVGPVKTVSASIYCGGSAKPAATTKAAPLSSAGDATIDAKVTLPKSCLAPIVLVHPNGQAGAYVAASGWAG